jgi:hypothetical protein
MKPGIREIIGKRIVGVVSAENSHHPRTQVFLLFSDGSRFEFYGERFTGAAGVDRASDVLRYIDAAGGKVTRQFGRVEPALAPGAAAPEQGGNVEALLKRDLDAWEMAKAAVARARRRR